MGYKQAADVAKLAPTTVDRVSRGVYARTSAENVRQLRGTVEVSMAEVGGSMEGAEATDSSPEVT